MIPTEQEGSSDSIVTIFTEGDGSDIPLKPSTQLPKYTASYLWGKKK
jgi:hypothetical protein